MVMTYLKVDIPGDALVVAFDICSSSDIMEELTLAGGIDRLKDFLYLSEEVLSQGSKDYALRSVQVHRRWLDPPVPRGYRWSSCLNVPASSQ